MKTLEKLLSNDSLTEDWISYVGTIELLFVAKGTKETNEKVMLLSFCCIDTFRLFQGLIALIKPEYKMFAEIVTRKSNHER